MALQHSLLYLCFLCGQVDPKPRVAHVTLSAHNFFFFFQEHETRSGALKYSVYKN